MRFSWLLLFGLAACSPYSFSKEVTDFSTGVDQLSTAFTAGFTQLAADRAATTELKLTGSRSEVAISDTCFKNVSPDIPCELYPMNDTPPTLTSIERKNDDTMAALAALADYAHALAAVTNAADRTDYNAAVAQLSGSVGELATNANAAAPGASIAAPAAVNLAGWVVGTALDQQRFESLKAAVTAVGTPKGTSPIATVSKTLGTGLEAVRVAREVILVEELQILQARLGPSLSDTDYGQGLSNAQAVVATLAGVRQSKPEAATDALVAAHDALVAAVNDPKRNYAALLKAVGDFADQASALEIALSAAAKLEKAAAKKGS